jgi:hypothetical protein
LGEEETVDHVIQGPNRKRSSAVRGSFHRMEEALNKAGGNTKVTSSMINQAKIWSVGGHLRPEDEEVSFKDHETVRNSLKRAHKEQRQLGWSSCLRGFLTKSWEEAQAEAMNAEGRPSTKEQANHWSKNCLKAIFQLFLEAWKLRNEAAHGSDPESIERAKRAQIATTVRHLYETSRNFVASDKHYFEEPIALFLSRSTYELQNGVENVTHQLHTMHCRSRVQAT